MGWIHGHGGRDEVAVVVGRAPAHFAPDRADEAGGDAVLEIEGRADGDHPLARPQPAGVADLHGGQILRVDLQQRDVRLVIAPDHLGLEFTPIGEPHGHARGVVDHVRVGENETIRADDEARTHAFFRRVVAGLVLELAEEIAERIVVVIRERIAEAAPPACLRAAWKRPPPWHWVTRWKTAAHTPSSAW